MKKIIITAVILIGMMGSAFGQKNFEWDVITESPSETKSELYSKTKNFIADAYVSAQDVIQNDDKEAGVILLKASTIVKIKARLNIYSATFNYTVKLYVKDNKHRIVIDDVYCKRASVSVYEWPKLPVSSTYPAKKGYKLTSLSKQKYLDVMRLLNRDLQRVVDSYTVIMNEPLIDNPEW